MSDNNFEYAGFWRRFAAYMLDWVILGFFLNAVYWFLRNQIQMGHIRYETLEVISGILLIPISIIITWCYYSGLESSPLQATLGKWLIGLYVTDENGERLTFGKATGRHFAKIISGIILGIGYILAGFTEKKQALHDTIAGCLVLKK
jgi:uncharacterized RDD family membrane protein YckC